MLSKLTNNKQIYIYPMNNINEIVKKNSEIKEFFVENRHIDVIRANFHQV